MQVTTLKRLLVIFVLALFLASLAPAAISDRGRDGGYGHHMMGHKIKRADVPITVTDMTGDSTSFTVNGMAIEGKKGIVMVVTMDKPLTGKYNMTNDMAYVAHDPMAMGGMNIRVDKANNTTLPVAGASAVLGLEKIKVNYVSKDYSIAEFGRMSVYTPDGAVKTYDLEKPVKVIKSKGRKTVVWDAYPGFTKALADALKGGTTFPADAAPLKLMDYSASIESSTPMKVEDTKPMSMPPPS